MEGFKTIGKPGETERIQNLEVYQFQRNDSLNKGGSIYGLYIIDNKDEAYANGTYRVIPDTSTIDRIYLKSFSLTGKMRRGSFDPEKIYLTYYADNINGGILASGTFPAGGEVYLSASNKSLEIQNYMPPFSNFSRLKFEYRKDIGAPAMQYRTLKITILVSRK
jgi:hypothetical protein